MTSVRSREKSSCCRHFIKLGPNIHGSIRSQCERMSFDDLVHIQLPRRRHDWWMNSRNILFFRQGKKCNISIYLQNKPSCGEYQRYLDSSLPWSDDGNFHLNYMKLTQTCDPTRLRAISVLDRNTNMHLIVFNVGFYWVQSSYSCRFVHSEFKDLCCFINDNLQVNTVPIVTFVQNIGTI